MWLWQAQNSEAPSRRRLSYELFLQELYLPFRAERFHTCIGWLQRLSLALELLTVQWLSVFSVTKRLLWFSFLSLRFEQSSLPCSGECGHTPGNACVLGVRMYYCCAEFKWYLSHHGCFSWRHKEHLRPKPSHHGPMQCYQRKETRIISKHLTPLLHFCKGSREFMSRVKGFIFKFSFLSSKQVNRLTWIFTCHLVMIAILIKVKSSSDGRYAFGAMPTELTHGLSTKGLVWVPWNCPCP